MDNDAKLSGWKHYPVHKEGEVINNTGTEKVATKFSPLRAGAEFVLKIRLHNMRKVEIGALLSALTFHNTTNTFHSIGMAKPLGYGKVKFEITDISDFEKLRTQNQTEYLKSFEAYMRAKDVNWENQAKELIAMSSEQNNSGSSELAYMKMETNGINEFVEAKKAKEALLEYSKLSGIQYNPGFILLASKNDIEAYKKKQIQENKIYIRPDIEELYKTKISKNKKAFIEKCKNVNLELKEKINVKTTELKSKLKKIRAEIDKRNVESLAKSLENISDYDKGKEIIANYKNKKENIPESEYQAIKDFIKRCYDNMGTKKQKKWSQIKKNPWKFISEKWVNSETAQLWFNEITNKK